MAAALPGRSAGGDTDLSRLHAVIRAAGESTDRVSLLLGLAGCELLAIGLGLAVAFELRPLQLWQVLTAAGAGGLTGFLLRFPVAAGFRRRHHRALRRRLAILPEDHRTALLLSLAGDSRAATRRLVAPLLR